MTLRKIKSYALITFGIFLQVFGWTAFLIPAQVAGGGMNGVSAVIFYITGFPMGFSTLIFNIILVLLGMRILGIKFALSSIFGILTLSLFFLVLPKYITDPIVSDRFMSTLIGAALGGAGVGIAISSGGNSGGTDIIALIVTKYRNISTGRVILYLDVVIIASSYLISRNLETVVFGYVEMAVVSYVIDLVIEGRKQSFQLTVISDFYEQISRRIGTESGRGITLLRGTGWYSQKEKDVLVCVCQRYDKQKILRIINREDPDAFITVAKVSAVFGENFDRVKL